MDDNQVTSHTKSTTAEDDNQETSSQENTVQENSPLDYDNHDTNPADQNKNNASTMAEDDNQETSNQEKTPVDDDNQETSPPTADQSASITTEDDNQQTSSNSTIPGTPSSKQSKTLSKKRKSHQTSKALPSPQNRCQKTPLSGNQAVCLPSNKPFSLLSSAVNLFTQQCIGDSGNGPFPSPKTHPATLS